MFKHQGKSRSLKHNLRIATVLSFVAGLVGISGFLAVNKLTTNVTGHFAFFINEFSHENYFEGFVYILYIFSFLLGAFLSNLIILKFKETKKLNIFVFPTIFESIILISVALFTNFKIIENPNLIAVILLFAMGIQNSFVTKISGAVLRTTHLTGLFTDLGIDLSRLFFPKAHPNTVKIKENIKLRLFIICFFFFGGSAGGFLFTVLNFQLNTLYFGAFLLLLSLFYDDFRFRVINLRRKVRGEHGIN
ncbi:YoaK family protein [Lutibacter sp.]|uniref:YoaK family protein n=1 Tax=Lutibacter sp. TaxID=1925666 RepID=UPI00356A6988